MSLLLVWRSILFKHRSEKSCLNILKKLSNFMKNQNHLLESLSYQNFRIINNVEKENILAHNKFKSLVDNKITSIKGIQENISALQLKKKALRKKRLIPEDGNKHVPGFWNVKALATAEEYNLEGLLKGLLEQNLYIPTEIKSSAKALADAIQVVAKYDIGTESREIYFFREGTAVMWNVNDLECNNLLIFLKQFEESSYINNLVQAEGEVLLYSYTESGKTSYLKEGDIFLAPDATLDKYTFSNAIAQSVKLGIWEASLDHYIDSIEFVTEDLKAGDKIKMTREEVLRKQGELFALRHLINLSSDLLDTPDFYWERDDLETLYQQTCAYFSIAKRTRVMNEKLNHCVELVELLSSHLSDRHHVRLEWMIIILIMVEVGFEILHYLDRYLTVKDDKSSKFSDFFQRKEFGIVDKITR